MFPISPSDQEIYTLNRKGGLSYNEIAIRYGMSKSWVWGKIRNFKESLSPEPSIILPVVAPTIQGNCIIVGDVHLPTTFMELAYLMPEVAEYFKIDTLIIAGDLLNFDALAKYETIIAPPTVRDELEAAKKLLSYWAQFFNSIIYTMGNHELRLFKKLEGSISVGELAGMLGDKVKSYISPYSWVISGGERWRITHPKNYSRNKMVVADVLSQKYQCNVVSHHEHHVGISRNKWNWATIVNNGGLHDYEQMSYVVLEDTNLPVMNNGFTAIVGGAAHLFTPYFSMTDWGLYDIDASRAQHIAQKQIDRRLGNG